MISRKLLLLVSLFLWEEFGGAWSAAKVVRRRGLGAQHSFRPEGKVLADQWEGSPEKIGMAMKNRKELLARDQAERSELAVVKKLSQNHGARPLLTKREDGQSFRTKLEALKLDGLDSAGHGLAGSNEAALEPRKIRNGTRSADGILKPRRTDKGLPIHHKIDFGLHPNRTRAKSLASSAARVGSAVHPGQNPKGLSLDSPRKVNLTGSYGLLKLISKENLVRIVNSQLQSVVGLNFQGKATRSRKRDLIDVDHSLSVSSKVKRQDRAIASDLYGGSDNQTEEPHVSETSHVNLNADLGTRSLWKPVSEFSSDSLVGRLSDQASPKGQLVTETWSIGGGSGKRLGMHPASTPQAEVLNTERGLTFSYGDAQVTLRSGMPNSAPHTDAVSPSVYTLDPWGVRTVSSGGKRERGSAAVEKEEKEHSSRDEALEESIQPPVLESSVTQDPVWGGAQRPNSSHILKLRPETEWAAGKMDGGGGGGGAMAADSWAGRTGHGLMFEEVEEDNDDNDDNNDDDNVGGEGRGHNEGGGKRSRSRRSWIWNQFFVIEEYTGPEPVLIGRVRKNSLAVQFRFISIPVFQLSQ